MQAAELDKDIYNSTTLSKSFARTPYFEMGIQLGTDNAVDTFPPIPTTGNTWKMPQLTNQLALASTPLQPNDDHSLISMNNQLLAHTLSSFCTELTTVVTAMLEANK